MRGRTLVEMRARTNPDEERRRHAPAVSRCATRLELHLGARPLSSKTAPDYRCLCDKYLKDWLDRALADVGSDRRCVRERHAHLTKERGWTTADYMMRVLARSTPAACASSQSCCRTRART